MHLYRPVFVSLCQRSNILGILRGGDASPGVQPSALIVSADAPTRTIVKPPRLGLPATFDVLDLLLPIEPGLDPDLDPGLNLTLNLELDFGLAPEFDPGLTLGLTLGPSLCSSLRLDLG